MNPGSAQLSPGSYFFTAALLLLIVARFLARELRDRRLPFNRFFATPIVLAFPCAFLIFVAASAAPDLDLELLIGCVAALAVGAGLGLTVDRFTGLRISDDRKAAIARGSWITVGIWLGALGLRWIGRLAAQNLSGANMGMNLVLNASLLVLIASAAAMLRVRLLARAKAIVAGAPAPG
jgi:hypothetical protein